MLDKLSGLLRRRPKEDVSSNKIRWLEEGQRVDLKRRGKAIKGRNVVLVEGGGTVYQEKPGDYLFDNECDFRMQYELHRRLTDKGLFPPGTDWYGYKEEGKFGLASVMPFCIDEAGVAKPYLNESSGKWTPEIYEEILGRIEPGISLAVKEGAAGYEEAVLWFGLLSCDAWRSDNWRCFGGRVYLVDFEGVVPVTEDRQRVETALARLRSEENGRE